MIGHTCSMPIVHTLDKGKWTLYEQDRWANGPWANGFLGEQVQGQKFLGKQTAIPNINYINKIFVA